MKAVRLWILLLLLLGTSLAYADGCFVPALDATYNADITEPEQKALILHHDGTEMLILQVSFKGSASNFAWLVPTPSVPEVKIADDSTFHDLHEITSPRTIYWFGDIEPEYGSDSAEGTAATTAVEVIEQATIGAYDIAVLKAEESSDLIDWLRAHHYQVSPKIGPVVDYYLKRGWVFTGMRINDRTVAEHLTSAHTRLSEGTLQSLSFKFRSSRPVYPLRISSLNPGPSEVLLYTATEHRIRARGMEIECAMRCPSIFTRDVKVPMSYASEVGLDSGHFILTKLKGSFTPARMTDDLDLVPDKTDDEYHPDIIDAGFVASLGAATAGWAYLAMMAIILCGPMLGIVLLFLEATFTNTWFGPALERAYIAAFVFPLIVTAAALAIFLPAVHLGLSHETSVGAAELVAVAGIILVLAPRNARGAILRLFSNRKLKPNS